jgi:hypothetical protein
MRFLKKNAALIILIAIFFVVLFSAEVVLTAEIFPKYSMSFFAIFAISSVQYLSYIKIRKRIKQLSQTLEQNCSRQETINRNLMFAIEEIIDLQRDKTPSEQVTV